MKSVYLVYTTDRQYSECSKTVIGVGSNFKAAMKICKWYSDKIAVPLSKKQTDKLTDINQTEGYCPQCELVIDCTPVNYLLCWFNVGQKTE